MTLKEKILSYRHSGLTQAHVAELCSTSQPKVSYYWNHVRALQNAKDSFSRYTARKHTALVDLTPQAYEAWVQQQSRS